jgi:hypothetical protein
LSARHWPWRLAFDDFAGPGDSSVDGHRAREYAENDYGIHVQDMLRNCRD